jgi:hypothetical protein
LNGSEKFFESFNQLDEGVSFDFAFDFHFVVVDQFLFLGLEFHIAAHVFATVREID